MKKSNFRNIFSNKQPMTRTTIQCQRYHLNVSVQEPTVAVIAWYLDFRSTYVV